MPAKSEAQQRLMGMALAAKRGKGHFSGKVQEVAKGMTEKQLHDFAATKHKGLPEKKAAQGILFELGKTMYQKQAEEKLKGGIGDDKTDQVFLSSELMRGVKHEGEHTKNKSIAKEIAKDHLTENKHYYTALAKAHIE